MFIQFITKPDVIIIAAVLLIMVLSKFGFGIKYISVKDIFINHINCFKGKNGKILIVPVINYFGVPILLASATVMIKEIDDTTINIITIIISILTAMLFTLLTVVIDMKSKIKDNPNYFSNEAKISNKALIETYYTVMFEILICIILLILCLFNAFTEIFTIMQSYVIYLLTYILIINLLMIIKRIFRVIDLDMNK